MDFVFWNLTLATILYWFCLIMKEQFQWIKYCPSILISSVNIYVFLFLVNRWWITGYFPLSNLYESVVFLTWCLTVVQLIFELRTSSKIIGSILTPIQLGLILFAYSILPFELQKPASLVPALQSTWLMLHVSMMLFSYAVLILGSAISILILCISSRLNQLQKLNLQYSNNFVSNFEIPFNGNYLIFSKLPNLIFNRFSSGFSTKWNFVNTLDVWSYRIISLGNIALTLGILAGSVWANESWGSYWSWDPKETWSLITWLVFTMYLHGRLINNWKGVKVAIIAVTGFISIWISYFGVNFLANGLHSYGWIS